MNVSRSTSKVSFEVLDVAPSDLDTIRLSKKYRDFRVDLLTALTNQSWGVRVKIQGETEKDVRTEIRNFTNAAYVWGRVINIKSKGLRIKTLSTKTVGETKFYGTIDIMFEKL